MRLRGRFAAKPARHRDYPVWHCARYRALRAFREEDAPFFFGREDFANELFEKLRKQTLVAVVGPSGSGKSSVVHAGVLPLLRRERPPRPSYDALACTPGKRPFHALAAALIPAWATETSKTDTLIAMEKLGNSLASGEVSLDGAISLALKASPDTDRLLVIVDQFEELFTLTPEADRSRFVKALLECTEPPRMTVVLTLRADFYGQAIGLSRDLSDRIQQGLVNIGPMTTAELRRAIAHPARNVGLGSRPGWWIAFWTTSNSGRATCHCSNSLSQNCGREEHTECSRTGDTTKSEGLKEPSAGKRRNDLRNCR